MWEDYVDVALETRTDQHDGENIFWDPDLKSDPNQQLATTTTAGDTDSDSDNDILPIRLGTDRNEPEDEKAVYCAACDSRVWTTQTRHDEDASHMTPIASGAGGRLFVGGIWNADNQRELAANRVETVVSMASEHSKKLFPNTIRYKFFHLEDADDEYAIPDFLSAAKFISDELPLRNVLVHCAMGRSRSVSAVAAYLIYSQHITFSQAIVRIRNVRAEANPNEGYRKQLCVIEALLSTFDFRIEPALSVAMFIEPTCSSLV